MCGKADEYGKKLQAASWYCTAEYEITERPSFPMSFAKNGKTSYIEPRFHSYTITQLGKGNGAYYCRRS